MQRVARRSRVGPSQQVDRGTSSRGSGTSSSVPCEVKRMLPAHLESQLRLARAGGPPAHPYSRQRPRCGTPRPYGSPPLFRSHSLERGDSSLERCPPPRAAWACAPRIQVGCVEASWKPHHAALVHAPADAAATRRPCALEHQRRSHALAGYHPFLASSVVLVWIALTAC